MAPVLAQDHFPEPLTLKENPMRSLIAIALIAFALPAAAFAGEFKLGTEKPLATITMPEDWETNEFDNGVEGTSPDGLYVAAEVVQAADAKGATEEALKYLISQGVTIGEVTAESKDTDTLEVNGMPYAFVDWSGKDKEGDAAVELIIYDMTKQNGNFLILTSWGPPALQKAEMDSYQSVLKSVIPIQ